MLALLLLLAAGDATAATAATADINTDINTDIDAAVVQAAAGKVATAQVASASPVTEAPTQPATLRVRPEAVSLTWRRDFQRVVVQRVRADGVTEDVSTLAEWTLADPTIAAREGDTLTPLADGETTLTVSVDGLSADVPVTVAEAAGKRHVRFASDVVPIFSKSGCNNGSCHGAARGKDGFNLSLFGFDPDGDYHRVTREQAGRRINLAVPEASLLVEKAVGAVPHTGGKLFDIDSVRAADLIDWIGRGALRDPKDTPVCTGIALYPENAVLEGDAEQPLTVVATYSDGSTRDVTPLAYFNSSNPGVATVSEPAAEPASGGSGGEAASEGAPTRSGILRSGERGEAFILARFDRYSVGSQVLTLPARLDFTPDFGPIANEIDRAVAAKLARLRINPSPVADDEEFLRRVTIDLTGLLPTPDEYRAFLADASPRKRARKIDELIETREFTDLWVGKWAELLMMRSSIQENISYKSIVLYHAWLKDQVAREVPFDDLVRALLTGSGGTFDTPETNFYERERDSLKTAENVAQAFMGMRIQCAQCHNHPFDRWTQDDYYGFAAFFGQIGRKNSEDSREKIIYDRRSGEVRHVVTNKNAPPTYLGDGPAETRGRDRRAVAADWLVDPENPYFATSIANRVWDHFFGLGIVQPVDDVRISNPPSNPELFRLLGERFAGSGYDFKQLVRDICNSTTYQRTSLRTDSNRTDERNFAHQTVRRIKAESMLDIISQATGTDDDFQGLPRGARAVEIADGSTSTYFLTTFGRAKRDTVCACEVKMEPTLSQALHLLNGDTTARKVQQGQLVPEMLKERKKPEQIIEELYIRCLTRTPTEAELASLMTSVDAAVEGVEPGGGRIYAVLKTELEDIFWALLNSREMVFNS